MWVCLCGENIEGKHFHKGGDLRDIAHAVNLARCTAFGGMAKLLSN